MNQPYLRMRFQMVGTVDYLVIERKGAYTKYSGRKKYIRQMLKKDKSNQLLTKE